MQVQFGKNMFRLWDIRTELAFYQQNGDVGWNLTGGSDAVLLWIRDPFH